MANQEPATGYSAPVSELRFEPRVDLQTRNFGEAQGDVTVRGGIFEGTSVLLGGLAVFDPQTGHYATEVPIPAAMLEAPRVLTGADHALQGFNATAGSVSYGWRPIRTGGEIALAFGSGSLNRQSVYTARRREPSGDRGPAWGVAAEVSRSQAAGIIENGDHRFFRVAGRLQRETPGARTELFAGHQEKFFGWPNLYTPFGVAETEDLRTSLVMLSHHVGDRDRAFETAAYFRRNEDDYEFDRFRPDLFNPYRHDTRAWGGYARLHGQAGPWALDTRADLAADSIESTSLVAGRFNSRSYWRLSSSAQREWETGLGVWAARLGGAFDDTNREPSAVSPVVELAWTPSTRDAVRRVRAHLEYSESTRVPGYTALNSPAGSGLFRGNPDLGRESSRNMEAGLQVAAAEWSLHAALFRRRDDPLVDWTFSRSAPNARSAQLVDIETTGFEVVALRSWSRFQVVAGYTWLAKNADYLDAEVDASFYALNFPRHRFTLAAILRLGGGFEIRSDNEFRVQEENLLRTVGGDHALISSLGLYWLIPQVDGLEVSLIADNLWNSRFQELPAVPAAGRQVTAGLRWHW